MANDPDKILDARMEYGLLVTILQSLGNMYWVGYGAFFTINTPIRGPQERSIRSS